MNEDQHLRDRDEAAQELLIERIKQAKLNAAEWFKRANQALADGFFNEAHRLIEQGKEELKRHGH